MRSLKLENPLKSEFPVDALCRSSRFHIGVADVKILTSTAEF